MAEFHFRAKVIGRKGGRSAVASAAYRAGARLELNGEVFDYSRRRGIEAAFILTPSLAPDHLRTDRQALWQMVEEREKRKDAQLARELEISLPLELSPDQRRALVEGFVRNHLVAAGMIADVAIHTGDAGGKDHQPHAHVMLTLRSLNADGTFGQKAREWNDRSFVEGWRAAWAEATNAALEAAGNSARVDHRSLEDRRADLLAQIEAEPDVIAAMRLRGQAMALDYIPQPELSPTEWKAMQSGEWPPEFAAKIEAFQAAAQSKAAAAELAQFYFSGADKLEQEAREALEAEEARQKAAQEAEARRIEEERQRAFLERERAAQAAHEAAREAEARRIEEERQRAALEREIAAQAAREAERQAEVRRIEEERQRVALEREKAEREATKWVLETAQTFNDTALLPVAKDRALGNFRELREANHKEREDWTAQRLMEPHGAGFLRRLTGFYALPHRVGVKKRDNDQRTEVAREDLKDSGFVRRVAEQFGSIIREILRNVWDGQEARRSREDAELRKIAWAEAGAFHASEDGIRSRAEIMAEQPPPPKPDQSQPSASKPVAPTRPKGGRFGM